MGRRHDRGYRKGQQGNEEERGKGFTEVRSRSTAADAKTHILAPIRLRNDCENERLAGLSKGYCAYFAFNYASFYGYAPCRFSYGHPAISRIFRFILICSMLIQEAADDGR